MAFFTVGGLFTAPLDKPSWTGCSHDVRRPTRWRGLTRTAGLQGSLPVRTHAGSPHALCDPQRPPAGPSTILCSSLRKERKKLAKVLKSHRKLLEKRLSALTSTEVESPVLSELLTELRSLTSHLDDQRGAVLLLAGNSGSDSSDSDDECATRSAASLRALRGQQQQQQQLPVAVQTGTMETAVNPASTGSSMVVSGMTGQLELEVPEPQEGWDWSEDEFRAARFPGAGGRVLVCTGSKCQRKGATEVLRAVSALSDGNPNIEVVPCKCVGKCSAGAALRIRPQGEACATYTEVRPALVRELFGEHFNAAPVVPEPVGAGAEAVAAACCSDCKRP